MSDTVMSHGLEAIEAAFDDFMDTGVADVDLNPTFPEGTYLLKFAEHTRAENSDKLYKSILSEKMIKKAVDAGNEPKAMGMICLHATVSQVVNTTAEDPAKMVGRPYVEEIVVGERSLAQLIKVAAACLGTTPKDLQADEAMKGVKLPDLVDALGGQEIVAVIKHRKQGDYVNAEFDYSAKAIMTNPEGFNAAQAA